MTPFISIIGTAVRPKYWTDVYNSIGKNSIPFEIIFVGPHEPQFELPKNFKFIKSMVKPVQCIEIASRAATGNFLLQMSDDVIFKNESPLDILYQKYLEQRNENVIVSCRLMDSGIDYSHMHHFYVDRKDSPIVPLSGLLSTKLYRQLGGIDRNFIAVAYDIDIAMRTYEIGGDVVLSSVFAEENKSKHENNAPGLYAEYGVSDRSFLESLWVLDKEKKILSEKRLKGFEPFDDFELQTKTQGVKGRWN